MNEPKLLNAIGASENHEYGKMYGRCIGGGSGGARLSPLKTRKLQVSNLKVKSTVDFRKKRQCLLVKFSAILANVDLIFQRRPASPRTFPQSTALLCAVQGQSRCVQLSAPACHQLPCIISITASLSPRNVSALYHIAVGILYPLRLSAGS